jgi:hypothetical protein
MENSWEKTVTAVGSPPRSSVFSRALLVGTVEAVLVARSGFRSQREPSSWSNADALESTTDALLEAGAQPIA